MPPTSRSRLADRTSPADASATAPRFGGVFWRLARVTSGLTRPLAGKRWNPIWAIVRHRGRRTGTTYETPVAARRTEAGFVVALTFGSQVDWYRNLLAADGGVIRWRERDYAVGAPRPLEAVAALPAFNVVQRLAMRTLRIGRFIMLPIVQPAAP